MRLLFAVLLATACGGHHSDKPAAASDLVPSLMARYATWLGELGTGWPSPVDCDGTLWAGEAKAAGVPLDLSLAEYAPGEIHRRPKTSGECYPSESASTVSNDMLTGYILGMWATKDLDALQRLESYGQDRLRLGCYWIMGIIAHHMFAPLKNTALSTRPLRPKRSWSATPND